MHVTSLGYSLLYDKDTEEFIIVDADLTIYVNISFYKSMCIIPEHTSIWYLNYYEDDDGNEREHERKALVVPNNIIRSLLNNKDPHNTWQIATLNDCGFTLQSFLPKNYKG